LSYFAEFLAGWQQSSWAIRCTTLGHDNWRRQLLNAGSAGLELLQKRDVEHLGPILTHIANNFIELRHDFGIIHNNFVFSPILNNPNLTYKLQGGKKIFDDHFFENHLAGLENARKRSLCWSEIVNVVTGNLKSINQLNNSLGTALDPVSHSQLSLAYRAARSKFEKWDLSSMTFHDFVSRKSKGSKRFRTIKMSANLAYQKKKGVFY
jgi:hypothetical protein